MNDQDSNKRSKLIDRLLNKESFGELIAAKWESGSYLYRYKSWQWNCDEGWMELLSLDSRKDGGE